MSPRIRIVALTAATLALLLGMAAPAIAKSYEFRRVDIQAVVAADGSMAVSELREFDFNGDFSWAEWQLDTQGSQGIDVTGVDGPRGPMTLVKEGAPASTDTYWVRKTSDMVTLHLNFTASNELGAFTIAYKVNGAAKRWADTSELYWKFIGDRSDVVTRRADVTIRLPKGAAKDTVRAWAHGPLTGTVTINEDGSVSLRVFDLPPKTFVEARVLFPQPALPEVIASSESRVKAILAEEGKLAGDANRVRRNARLKVALAGGCSSLLSLLGLIVAIVLFVRYGREYKASFPGGYWREVPEDLSPALVSSLWKMGSPEDSAVTATLMDLAIRGVVKLEPVEEQDKGGLFGIGAHTDKTYSLTLDRSKLDLASSLERQLIDLLFDEVAHADSFNMEELKKLAKAHPETIVNGLKKWKQAVEADGRARGFLEKTGETAKAVTFGLATLLGIVSIGAAMLVGGPIPALGVPVAIVMVVLALFMSRRSRAANELYAKYRGLRDYLRDFSRLDEQPPTGIVLWERFLVLAVVFGIAEQVIEAMRLKLPEILADPGMQTAYWWAYAGHGYGTSPMSALGSGLTSATSIATSQMSSASGGGGGFSGGGGGGGGGGGVSAG
jgi:uncharacterized membrane protein